MKQFKFSEIDKAVQSLDLSEVGVKNSDVDNLSVEAFEDERKVVVSEKFLKVYNVVKPILQTVAMFPFFPSKWRAVVTVFINALDDLVADPE